jgi:hypothetical protein
MQLASMAEIHFRNYGSWRAVLKAGRSVGYKFMTIFYAGGPCCLLGYDDALLKQDLFANVKFRCVFGPPTVARPFFCVCGEGENLMGRERFDVQNLLRMWQLACVSYRYASSAKKVGSSGI